MLSLKVGAVIYFFDVQVYKERCSGRVLALQVWASLEAFVLWSLTRGTVLCLWAKHLIFSAQWNILTWMKNCWLGGKVLSYCSTQKKKIRKNIFLLLWKKKLLISSCWYVLKKWSVKHLWRVSIIFLIFCLQWSMILICRAANSWSMAVCSCHLVCIFRLGYCSALKCLPLDWRLRRVLLKYLSMIMSIVQINKKVGRKIAIISLSICLNICFGCSKEPSHWDGSFEYPQHIFWLRNKKINF